MVDDTVSRRRRAILNGFARSCAIRWMEQLPPHVRPVELSRQFPSVLRMIAAKWSDAPACRRYLSKLQLDDRSKRQGFPFAIVCEICVLRDYLDSLHAPPPTDIWWRLFDTEHR